jgi:hypothetical protein
VQVAPLVRGAVELGVLLGRVDERGDPVGRVDDLPQEVLGLDGVRPSARPPATFLRARPRQRHRGRRGRARRRRTPRRCPSRPDIVVIEPVAEGVLGVGRLDRGQLGCRAGLGHGQFLRRHQLLQPRPVRRSLGDRAQLVPRAHDAVAQGDGRAAGRGGGLLSSWVRPAASLPRASRRSRGPTRTSALRSPSGMPYSSCTANGYQARNAVMNSRARRVRNVDSLVAWTVAR